MEHSYGTVADFLRSHPDATLDMMTPGGFVLLTPELGAGLLAGGAVPAHPGCPGRELERMVEADELLCQTFSEPTQDKKDQTRIRHLEMPHIRFHDLRHTAVTNMHQLTGDFYTVGEILGHTLKGIGMSLGISTNLEAVTAQYVDVRLERKKAVLETYHKALHPQKAASEKDTAIKDTPRKTKKRSSGMEL